MAADRDLKPRAEPAGPLAQLELATALLRDTAATQDQFERAVSLVEQASAAGDADATEMLAVFEAMGAARPQSWERSFDMLQLAALRGSASAGRQLIFLADPSVEADVPRESGPQFWAEVRGSISLDRLLRSPDRKALFNGPRIRTIEGFASPAECRWLIDRSRTMLRSALVFNPKGEQVADPGRTNKGTDFQLPDMDVVTEVIRARIAAATRIPVPVFEPTQVLHYSVGQEFKRHLDYLDPDNPHHQDQLRSHGQRIATFLVYLNEDFEGGATEFSKIGIRFRGKTGDAIFWPNLDMEGRPDQRTLHAGLPPTSGEKWILSQWIRDRAPPRR
jgi:prolyl 4-hydroxylase